MTRALIVMAVLALYAVPGAAQPSADAELLMVRADALLGLGRVARDAGDHAEAERRFRESEAIRPFDADLRREYFWIAARTHPVRAMRAARALADADHADLAVVDEWLSLAAAHNDQDEVHAAARRGDRLFPNRARWPRRLGESLLGQGRAAEAALAFARAGRAADATPEDHAMHALSLEQSGDMHGAARVWTTVAAPVRDARRDWRASHLRTAVAQQGLASARVPLHDYVRTYPDDAGMRAMAVEAWAAAGEPARALRLMTPLLTGVNAASWRRREGELAAAAGDLSRARTAYARVVEHGSATPDDRWRLLELTAATDSPRHVADVLDELRSTDTPCATRSLSVADMAAHDLVFARVLSQLPAHCVVPDHMLLRAAAGLAASGAVHEAERVMRQRLAQPDPPDAVVLALVDVLEQRRERAQAIQLLDAHLARVADPSFVLMERLTWMRHEAGQSAEAWRLVQARLAPERVSAEASVRWAGLALAAGDLAAAARLASRSVDSPDDLAARHVLATVAMAQGRPQAALEWLTPVAAHLEDPGMARVWLEAIALVRGPGHALEAAADLTGLMAADVEVASLCAVWAAQLGRVDVARERYEQVAAADAGRGRLLVLQMAVATGRPVAALEGIGAREIAFAPDAELRLLATAAVDAHDWRLAAEALDEWRRRGLSASWALRKTAEVQRGSDGSLSTSLQASLDAAWSAGERDDELAIHLAASDAAAGSTDAALARLGWPANNAGMSVAVREAAAAVLLASGRLEDVLALVHGESAWPVSLDLLRARALAASGRSADAREVLERIAPAARRLHAWLLLADMTAAAPQRVAVLEHAASTLPDAAPLWSALAQARYQAGDVASARSAALKATELDTRAVDAWRVRMLAPPASEQERVRELEAAGQRFGSSTATLLMLAEAALVPGMTGTQSAALIEGWLNGALSEAPAESLLLRVRLAVAMGEWNVAIRAVQQALASSPDDLLLQHLDAQVHAWSGRHADARHRYDALLRANPAHADAWREYARLLSWMQDSGGSAAAYAAAARLQPSAGLTAEAGTKAAMARGAWRRASDMAANWVGAEPGSLDAAVDRAVALDRAGAFDEAAAAFAAVAGERGTPDDLRQAAARYATPHRPSAAMRLTVDAANGFGGQQLIEQRLTSVTAADRLGVGGRHRVFAEVGRGILDADAANWGLTRLLAGTEVGLAPGWRAEVAGGWTELGGASGQPTGRLELGGVLADGLSARLSAERRPFWENGRTVAAGVSATGTHVALEWQPAAQWRVSSSSGLQWLNDGNRRHEAAAVVARRVSHGLRDLELRSSTTLFGYRQEAAMYFTPRHFLRSDIEAEVRHWFGRPRTDGDQRAFVSGGLGVGADSRHARYGLGTARLSVPLGGAWCIMGEGRWTRSDVYRASTAAIWLQVGGERGR